MQDAPLPDPLLVTPPGPEAAAPALAAALRHALGDAAGRVVLRVEPGVPHRRRVARDLLQTGALASGGQVLDGPNGDLLLIGAERGRAERLRILVERLAGPDSTLLWSLERDAKVLLSYAAGGIAAAPRARAEEPSLAGLDRFVAGLPLVEVVQRLAGHPPGQSGPPAFLRLEPDRATLADRLGPLAQDADLLDHAGRRIAARLLAALGDAVAIEALLLGARPTRLHLPFAAEPPQTGLPAGRLVATLPLAAAAEPDALAETAARLAAAGIGLEFDRVDAAALVEFDLAALPPALLRLRWSPALESGAARRALAALDPTRVILAEATDARAVDFAAALGIAMVERPA